MRNLALSRAAVILIIGINPLCVGSARAALGADAASVRSDGAQLRGEVASTSLDLYEVDEITDGSGMRVREYLNRAGIVFAVAWSSPAPPDLQQLLGTHFSVYATALAALDHPGLHRSVRIDAAGLIVEAGGHLRAYTGRAYLPALIPTGVANEELR